MHNEEFLSAYPSAYLFFEITEWISIKFGIVIHKKLSDICLQYIVFHEAELEPRQFYKMASVNLGCNYN